MTDRTQRGEQNGDAQDALKLEIEEVADLDVPSGDADDVRGASGTHQAGVRGEVGMQNC